MSERPTRRARNFKIGLGPVEVRISLRRKPNKRPKNSLWLALDQHRTTSLLIACCLAAAMHFGTHLYAYPKIQLAAIKQHAQPITPKIPVVAPKTLPHSEPTQIHIPRLGIDADLIAVGNKSDGTLDTPKSYEVAGWYQNAPTPGELGPAVIVGHVDSIHGPAVFWRISQMTPGDELEIDRSDQTVAKFKVIDIKQFPQGNFPTQEVYGNLNYAGLRLITCGGIFNHTTGRYSDNTVVFAELVS